ncbi:predicted protein [Botrytis cinerea T4]|uniref:Uncharacterized protein n=1 Tax=Botryotinia fuckeliana (strain T4) TaxID=999810 RepID=G2YEI6_BOTF4|nr:predicted protein [Botrytis cinerea T4]
MSMATIKLSIISRSSWWAHRWPRKLGDAKGMSWGRKISDVPKMGKIINIIVAKQINDEQFLFD